MVNKVGRPLPQVSSVPGFDRPRVPPPPPEAKKLPPGPIESWSAALRYEFAQFLGPEEMLVLGVCSTAWYELTASEVLWEMLTIRLDAVGYMHVTSQRHQAVAIRDLGFADGRAWAWACLFAQSWRNLVANLPAEEPRFVLVDFMNAPGLQDATAAERRHPIHTAADILPKPLSAAFALQRVTHTRACARALTRTCTLRRTHVYALMHIHMCARSYIHPHVPTRSVSFSCSGIRQIAYLAIAPASWSTSRAWSSIGSRSYLMLPTSSTAEERGT